ncbi:MAG TPA: hypothetical protein VFB95_10890 [Candidatus Cryosericum sp.]|nr:hypothetical protein [Candidatus Cryosericum sp.]
MHRRGRSARMAEVAVAGALSLAAFGCVGLQRNPNVVGTYSEKLSPYNYREEGSLALMVVGVDAARFIRQEAFVPLFVQVANKSKITFEISSESFILEDSVGRQYGTAAPEEVAAKYARLDIDRRVFQQNRSITTTYMSLYTYVRSDFYPSITRRTLLIDHVSLPPRSFMEDILYFPIPETGLNGVPLRLLFQVKGLTEPIQVVFEVPKTLGILEKDEKDKEKEEAP